MNNYDFELFNTNDYIKNLIPDLSYFNHYEILHAFNKTDNMMGDLFKIHTFTPMSNNADNTNLIIESYRCLLLSNFTIELKSTNGSYFSKIGMYGERYVYCYYKNDEDNTANDKFYITDNDEYINKEVEELRF